MLEQQETPSLLSLAESGKLTKAEVHRISEHYIEQMQEGTMSPLEVLAKAEFLSQILSNIKERAREIGVDTMYRIGAEATTGVSINGVTLRMKEAGVKYDYSANEAWSQLMAQETQIANQRKEVEATLKTLKAPMDIVNTDTGELHTMYPPVKTSKTTIEITLKTK
mgnify:CR=1 FL=1